MIYTKKLKQKLFVAKVVDWQLKLIGRVKPKNNAKVIDVWWEWNGSTKGQYDIFWYVGKVYQEEMSGMNWEARIEGSYKTMNFGRNDMKLFKAIMKLERDLHRKYPNYQLI